MCRTGAGDQEYYQCVTDVILPLIDRVAPGFVLYDAGADVHADDPLGLLKLTDAGIFKRDYAIIRRCLDTGVPIACVIGGGYTSCRVDAARVLGRRHSILFHAATRAWNDASVRSVHCGTGT